MSRHAAAVVRLSSLGDVLLAAHVPGFLKREDASRRVLFVTKEGYAGLRAEEVEEIVDLHRNWRSSRLLAAFPRAKRRLAPKYALRRRLWVYARWLRPKPVPPLLRSYRSLLDLDPGTEVTPWLRDALSPAEQALGLERAGSAGARGFALLGTGARWETKRWPAARFVQLAECLERERGIGSLFAVDPAERPAPEIEAWHEARSASPLLLPFRDLAAVASHALAIVSNDSAVLHLGPALGVPAVGIFGGTVPELGFARQAPRDEAVGIRLGCRPCGVHGRTRCPLGHHACMRQLSPDLVLDAIDRVRGGEAATRVTVSSSAARGRP